MGMNLGSVLSGIAGNLSGVAGNVVSGAIKNFDNANPSSSTPSAGTPQHSNFFGSGMPFLPTGYDPNSAPAQMYQAWAKSQQQQNSNPSSGVAQTLTPLHTTPASSSSTSAPDSTGTGLDDNNNNKYLNPYWTQVQQQGNTSRELQQNEDLNTARQQEADLYKINPNQVNVNNVGGKTYLQVPWSLAQNHAYNQSALEQAQSQPQRPTQQQPDMNQMLSLLGIDPNAINQQAQNMYQTQSNSINQIIAQDQAQQKAEDALLQTQLNDAVNSQNTTSFQDWLKAREGIAQRGLGNSGFLNDAMVRNQLNNEDKMQGIYNTAMDNQQKSDATYQGDIAKQQQALASLDPAQMFNTLYSQQIKDATPFLPYMMQTANQQAQLAQQQYAFNNLSADQRATLAQQAQNEADKQINAAGGAVVDGKIVPSLAEQQALGYINGQPTVAMQKEIDQNIQWAKQDQLDTSKFDLSVSQFQEKTQYDSALIQEAQQKINNSSLNSQITGQKAVLDQLGMQLDSMRSNGASQSDMKAVSDKYNSVMNNIAQLAGMGGVDLSSLGGNSSSTQQYSSPIGPVDPNVFTGSMKPMPQNYVSSIAQQALKTLGLPTTDANVNALVQIAQHESSLEPGQVNGTYIDPRTGQTYSSAYIIQNGNPMGAEKATGLMQTLPSTFNEYKAAGHGNIMNPLDNMLAAINYIDKSGKYKGDLQKALQASLNGGY